MKGIKRLLVLMLIMVMAIVGAAVPAFADDEADAETEVAAEPGSISVTGYKVSNIKSDSGKSKSTIEKDYTFTIDVDFMVRSEQESKISEITKALDGFAGGNIGKVSSSSKNKFSVTIKDLKYKGGEKALNLIVSHDGIYEDVSINISECVEYVEPQKEETPEEPEVIAQPTAVFSRNKMNKVKADKEATITVNVKNNGSTAMLDPVLEVSPSESLVLLGSRTQFELGDIKAGSTGSVNIKVKGMSAILSENQSLDLNLKFNYNNGTSTIQGLEAGKVTVPARVTSQSEPKETTQPTAVFSRKKMNKVRANKERVVTLKVKNNGSTTMLDPVLEVSPSESIMLLGNRTQFELGNIKAGATRSVDVKIKGMSPIASENQSLDLNLKFNYKNAGNTVQGTEAGKVNIPAVVTKEGEGEQTDAPAPNVIVSSFDYGGSSVAAGSEFDLAVTLKNTSKNLAIENIVVTLDGGADFILNGGTNTFHFDKLGAGDTHTVSVPYKVVPTITSSANSVAIGVKYEYVDQKRRIPTTADLQVSVPQYQPDKFELGEPVVQMEGYVGEENSITIDYVNKGKSEISNVEATVEGDVDSYMPTQKLGNFESGKSGTIAFVVTPLNEGENEVTMTISYEDSNGNVKERVVNTTIYASSYEQGEWEDPGTEEPVEPEGGSGIMAHKWVAIPVVLIAAIVGLIVARKKRKAAKAKKQAEMMAKWDEEE